MSIVSVKRGRLTSRLLMPPIAIGLLFSLLISGFLIYWPASMDAASRDREQALVANGFTARVAELESLVTPNADWDDAVTHLALSYSADWARDNVGVFFTQTSGFQLAYLLDASDRPIYGRRKGSDVDPGSFEPFAAASRTIVARVRAAEAARGPLKPKADGAIISTPIQASTVAVIAGTPLVLTATLVQPDFGTALPPGPRAPVVITGRALTGDFLKSFANRYLLEGAQVVPLGDARARGLAQAALRVGEEAPVVALRWSPRTPGRDLLGRVLPPLGVLVLILGGALVWVARRLHRQVLSPLSDATRALADLANGRSAGLLGGLDRTDEIGDLSRAFASLDAAAREADKLRREAHQERERREAESQTEQGRRQDLLERQNQVVESLAEGLEKLSHGRLDYRIETQLAPEYERLRGVFNATVGELGETIKVIVHSAQTIHSGVEQIQRDADDLSGRTGRQAESLDRSVQAVAAITGALRTTSQGAERARQVAAAAHVDAQEGGQVALAAVEAMAQIEQSSGQIVSIISVIDEIALQTNLLALNAGVEAARAGEAGRGFAVVASEVRSLAQRSADAAKQIKALITESEAKVSEGVALVGRSGEALTRIVTRVDEINQLAAEIAHSAQAQGGALEGVNRAVGEMDQVTRQNTSMVRHSATTTRGLAAEVARLNGLVGRFTLDAEATGPARFRSGPGARPSEERARPLLAR
jgi:methyl-accepting chemotaxis protein